jgi:hypothetical protein
MSAFPTHAASSIAGGAGSADIGTIIAGISAPSTSYLELSGQAVLKSAYPALAGTGGPLASDPFQFEASSFLSVQSASGFNDTLANRENQLVSANGFDVAVSGSAGGNLYYSADGGLTYTTVTAPFGATVSINGLIYADTLGLWIAYGGGSATGRQIFSSPDLQTWTNRYNECAGTATYVHGGWGNGLIVLVASAGANATSKSANGTAWTHAAPYQTPASNNGYLKFFPDFGLWVYAYSTAGFHNVDTSPDGGIWTNRIQLAVATYGPTRKVIQVADRLVAFGDNDVITNTNCTIRYTTTTAGTTWGYYSIASAPAAHSLKDAAFNGQVAVFIGQGGSNKVYLSRDGYSLEDVTPTISTIGGAIALAFYRVYWTGKMFILCGAGSGSAIPMLASYDGRTWFVLARAISNGEPWQIIFNGTRLIAVASSGIFTSIPRYNTTNYVWLPQRNNQGVSYYVRAK